VHLCESLCKASLECVSESERNEELVVPKASLWEKFIKFVKFIKFIKFIKLKVNYELKIISVLCQIYAKDITLGQFTIYNLQLAIYAKGIPLEQSICYKIRVSVSVRASIEGCFPLGNVLSLFK